MLPKRDRYRRSFSFLICTVFAVQFAWSFYHAWSHTDADFPSYYTAAHLVVEREPLRDFYDMARFQQHMDALVLPNRLGGYIPQTPLTMLPLVPLSNVSMQDAKRIWLLIDVALLSVTVWILAQVTSLRITGVIGFFALGFGSLHTNLQLGQYYVLVLFLLTLAGYFLVMDRDFASGGILGLVCSLKLMTLPFIFYFAWRRQWRALGGICVALGVSCALALALFGGSDLNFYLEGIWPRSMAGETLDPFNAANGTLITLLRRLLVREPELNPAAILDCPALFFFLSAFLPLSVLLFALPTFGRARSVQASYAGFLLSLFLVSPNTASYTFLLLLLPTALLLCGASRLYQRMLLLCYFLLALPMRPSWNWLFPKVWLLIAMFCIAWMLSGRRIRARTIVATLSLASAVALVIAIAETRLSDRETHRRWQHLVGERGEIYSSRPIPMNDGLVYQSIKDGAYKLRYRRGGTVQDLVLGGNILHPELLADGDVVRFESVRGGIARRFLIDPRKGPESPLHTGDAPETVNLGRSPNGKWIVCERSSRGQTQLYLVDEIHPTRSIQVTEGRCNSFAPAWERDGAAIVFASDCGRGVGMPALYRAELRDMLRLSR